MRVTLKDIAKTSGYSINTVSHALNDKDDISLETRKKIKEIAKNLGYIPNTSASYLRSGKSRTIAVIVGDISNPHFSIICKEIEKYMQDFEYTIIMFNTDEDQEKENNAVITALSKNVDGVIICPVQKSSESIERLKESRIPFTLLGRYFSDVESDYVICDDVNGGYVAARYLLNAGHKNILFINGMQYISSAYERLKGITHAMEEYNLTMPEEHIINLSLKPMQDHNVIRNSIISNRDCSAIIAFNDMIAWEVITVLNSLNLRCPQDVSVIGFDNIQSRYMFPVELTTVSTLKATMAQIAVEILISRMKSFAAPPQTIVLPTRLIIRRTTGEI